MKIRFVRHRLQPVFSAVVVSAGTGQIAARIVVSCSRCEWSERLVVEDLDLDDDLRDLRRLHRRDSAAASR